jgi:hypothetical protein
MTNLPVPTTGGTVATSGPVGETNLDNTRADLSGVSALMYEANGLIDRLSQVASLVQEAIVQAMERPGRKPDEFDAAIDSALGWVNGLRRFLGASSETLAAARDELAAADVALTPAIAAQEDLHAVGADGEFVAYATG